MTKIPLLSQGTRRRLVSAILPATHKRSWMALALALSSWATTAQADEAKADCTVYEIRSGQGKGGIDPALAPLKSKLTRPPLSAWSEHKLLKKHNQLLSARISVSQTLTNGSTLTLLLRERVDSAQNKTRLRFEATVADKSSKRVYEGTHTIDSGDSIVVGGAATGDGGTHVSGILCVAH